MKLNKRAARKERSYAAKRAFIIIRSSRSSAAAPHQFSSFYICKY